MKAYHHSVKLIKMGVGSNHDNDGVEVEDSTASGTLLLLKGANSIAAGNNNKSIGDKNGRNNSTAVG